MNRRNFIALSGSALLHSTTAAHAQAAPASKPLPSPSPRNPTDARPNILLLMADQLRYDCVGAYGNPAIRTPNLDRLAQQGIRFQNAYTCTPTCIPARTALMTGLGPWRHGMLGMTRMATKPYPVEKAAAMSAAGYYTTSIGKNHYSPISNPHGYHQLITDEHCTYRDHTDGPLAPQSSEQRCDYESWFWSQLPGKDPHATGLGWNDQPSRPFAYPEELHATHWTGTTAVRFLQHYDRPEPFFLKVSFIRPHSPYDPPKRFFDMYENTRLPQASVGAWASSYAERNTQRDDLWHGKLSPEEIHHSRQGYYGSVSFVDEQIGRILTTLREQGLADNTMIVFFSDHGDMLGDHNLWRKSYGYESSAHIPLLLKPAASQKIPSARVITNPVEIRDLLPTFLDTAGVPTPSTLEGRSLLHLLRTNGADWRQYIDLEHNVCYSPENHWNGLTDGLWKYLFHAYSGEEQLFHLAADPQELNDLALQSEHQQTLHLWRTRLVDHLRERGEAWVSNGQLVQRKESMMLSPNFPGYTPA